MSEFELIFNKFRNNKMVFNKIKEGTKYYNYYVLSKEELEKAIEQYNSRDRRYGGIKEDEENV